MFDNGAFAIIAPVLFVLEAGKDDMRAFCEG